jgi:hypothetical protein
MRNVALKRVRATNSSTALRMAAGAGVRIAELDEACDYVFTQLSVAEGWNLVRHSPGRLSQVHDDLVECPAPSAHGGGRCASARLLTSPADAVTPVSRNRSMLPRW